jgi:hypothetical protein
MSEAELHVLRARLRGGMLNKARRGELLIKPPIGLLYNSEGVLVLDPDKQVQQSLRLLFDTFRRGGSAMATVKAFRNQGLLIPDAFAVVRRVGTWCGALSGIARCCESSTIRVMPEPLYSGDTTLEKRSMGIVRSCRSHRGIGRR